MLFRIFTIFLLVHFLSCGGKKESTSQTSENISAPESIYIGTYTRKEGHVDGKADGIYKVDFDPATGILSNTRTVAKTTNPSFLAKADKKNLLFSISELAQTGERSGVIESYAILPNDSLKLINSLPTGGRAPCHVLIDPTESYVIVSHYLDGVINFYRIISGGILQERTVNIVSGSSVHPRQDAAHVHSATMVPDRNKIVVADLGSDKLWLYNLNYREYRLQTDINSIDMPPGSGPRHLDISEDGRVLYVVNELNSTVSVIESNWETSEFKNLQNISTLPLDYSDPNTGADIHLHPNGKYLLTSNRGHNSIAIFSINADQTLTFQSHVPTKGETPRNFAISPDGEYLLIANQDTDNIVVYRLEENAGLKVSFVQDFAINTPVCIVF